jgi:hypothetical protein
MAGKSNAFQTALLDLIFNATVQTALTNLAQNAATSPLTSLFVALHTADPTNAGSQSSDEISYTGYARVAVARTTSGWTVSGDSPASVSPAANIVFGAMTGGTGGTVTNWSVGVAASGAGDILYSGTVSPNIVVTTGVTPELTTASTITED